MDSPKDDCRSDSDISGITPFAVAKIHLLDAYQEPRPGAYRAGERDSETRNGRMSSPQQRDPRGREALEGSDLAPICGSKTLR